MTPQELPTSTKRLVDALKAQHNPKLAATKSDEGRLTLAEFTGGLDAPEG